MSAAFASKQKDLSDKFDCLVDIVKLVSEQIAALQSRVSALESDKLGTGNAVDNRRHRATGKASE